MKINKKIVNILITTFLVLLFLLLLITLVNKRLLAVERERCKIWDYKWCSQLPK